MSTKIFGLADLPVETIGTVVQVNSNSRVPEPDLSQDVQDFGQSLKSKNLEPLKSDTVQLPKKKVISNGFIKMRNGIGKLMSHFSKVKIK